MKDVFSVVRSILGKQFGDCDRGVRVRVSLICLLMLNLIVSSLLIGFSTERPG